MLKKAGRKVTDAGTDPSNQTASGRTVEMMTPPLYMGPGDV